MTWLISELEGIQTFQMGYFTRFLNTSNKDLMINEAPKDNQNAVKGTGLRNENSGGMATSSQISS